MSASAFEDDNRILWVGTDRGVYQYNPASDVFTAVNLKTKDGVDMNNWVSNIIADSLGNIWVSRSGSVSLQKQSTLFNGKWGCFVTMKKQILSTII